MVFMQPQLNPLPGGTGGSASSSAGTSASATTSTTQTTTTAKRKVRSEHFIFILIAATITVIVLGIAGWIAYVHVRGAVAEAQAYTFQEVKPQSVTGIQDHTTVRMCYNFATHVPIKNDTSISASCASLAPGAYLEQINVMLNNTSVNNYQEVTVCGALVAQNDGGKQPTNARDNCVRFSHVAPGCFPRAVTSSGKSVCAVAIEMEAGQLPGNTRIEILDLHGIATVNYHAIAERNAFCNTANAPPFCA